MPYRCRYKGSLPGYRATALEVVSKFQGRCKIQHLALQGGNQYGDQGNKKEKGFYQQFRTC
ncbi:MAG: hypothetical protein JWN76_3473 [Chitinophagaceae bacterium]|nr:hypothetical protein [Chitinophagaceae bacterium]